MACNEILVRTVSNDANGGFQVYQTTLAVLWLLQCNLAVLRFLTFIIEPVAKYHKSTPLLEPPAT